MTFTLTTEPAPCPRVDGWRGLITAYLDLPRRWTDRDVRRLERILESDRLWVDDQYDDDETIERATETVKEWRRIESAPPFPTTAQVARAARSPQHDERALRIYDRIQAKVKARRAALAPLLKPRKTYQAIKNEERRVYGNDPTLDRLGKANAMLASHVDLSTLLWNRDSASRRHWG